MKFRTFRFVAPSGYFYEIREQNGADEDILSNPCISGLIRRQTIQNIERIAERVLIQDIHRKKKRDFFREKHQKNSTCLLYTSFRQPENRRWQR